MRQRLHSFQHRYKMTTAQLQTGADEVLSLYQLLNPQVLANPYPLFHRLRSEDPVHWDPFLHAWVVTRYKDVVTVLYHYSAGRTPTPEQLTAMCLESLNRSAQVMVKQMLFLDAPRSEEHTSELQSRF